MLIKQRILKFQLMVDSWDDIYQVAPTEYNIWEPVYVDLSNFADESDLLIAFHSNDQQFQVGTGWAVDDVTLLSAYQEEEGFHYWQCVQ